MCAEYKINGKVISFQKELVKIFPLENIIFHTQDEESENSLNYSTYSPDSCLCPIDAFATAKKNNIRVIQTSMYYHFGEDEINKAIEWEKKQVGGGWWATENSIKPIL